MRQIIIKVSQNFRTKFGACCFLHELQSDREVLFCHICFPLFDGNHGFVQVLVKNIIHIQYICDTAAHTCCKVLSSLTKYDYAATCHIFTAMFSYTFYNCRCTGVTDCETLTCNTIDKCGTAGCTVEGNVTYDNVLFCFVCSFLRNFQNQFTTGKTFSEVVVAVAGQFSVRPFGINAPKLCPPAPLQCTVIVSSASPSLFFLVISAPRMVPNVRSMFVRFTESSVFSTFPMAYYAFLNQNLFHPWSFPVRSYIRLSGQK